MVRVSRETAWELGLRVTVCVCTHVCTQVVYNVGLCICLFDITKLEDAYVFPGDGASHTKGGCTVLRHWVSAVGVLVGRLGVPGPSPDSAGS